ncbi:MAG: methyl-accepting chemotaxis protein [Lachnospiraceae bacterium]|nr:methyl-accepting chemotaxis protein [Lachnospiraceae bacterium]
MNIAILLSFLATIAIVITSINSLILEATQGTHQVMELLTAEKELREDVVAIQGNISNIMGLSLSSENYNYSDTIKATKEKMADLDEKYAYIATQSVLANTADDPSSDLNALGSSLSVATSQFNKMLDAAQLQNFKVFMREIAQNDYVANGDAVYAALDGMEETIDGMVKNTEKNLEKKRNAALMQILVCLVFVVAVIGLSFFLNYIRINRTVARISKEIRGIINKIQAGEGDLTARVQTKTTTEIGEIVEGFNLFIASLQEIIADVKHGSGVLNTSSEAMTMKIRKASDNITNTSASLQELTASMDTMEETAHSMVDKLEEVRRAANEILENASAGEMTAQEVKEQAQNMKDSAIRKKEHTGERMSEMSVVLEASVQNSAKVSQIDELTNDILSIASQTNLLALNASIEAARAGDAGRGFAVVAGEIGTLAENSKNTASRIQEISSEVTEAVNTLAANASDMVTFINETVLHDYDAFVESGENYNVTADIMEDLLRQFTLKADNLHAIMNDMSNSVNAITASVTESTQAINSSAMNASEIVEQINGINEDMEQNNDVTRQLNERALKFEIV